MVWRSFPSPWPPCGYRLWRRCQAGEAAGAIRCSESRTEVLTCRQSRRRASARRRCSIRPVRAVSVDTVIPMPGMAEGIVLLLTLETVSVPVHLGPMWYIERLDRRIEVGDWIDVKGSKAFAAGVSAVIAAEVRKSDSVLVLRDAAGVPAWTGWQRIRRLVRKDSPEAFDTSKDQDNVSASILVL